MPQIKPKTKTFKISRTKLNPSARKISELGAKLTRIAREIEASDGPAFTEADIENELEKRRGGFVRNGQ